MIERLDLDLFKCFQKLRLPLAELTFLSGANASGKSSVIQSLVLLHQTMRDHEWSTKLILNGDAIKLGTVADVVDKVNGRQSFSIGLSERSGSYNWTFEGERGEMSPQVAAVTVNQHRICEPQELRHLLPKNLDRSECTASERLRRLSYITAERIGPRDIYELEDPSTVLVVGPRGEHAASVLHWSRQEPVNELLALEDVPKVILKQVEARMNVFFPGCELGLQQVPNTNAVTLGFRVAGETSYHRPIHVGFGLTQVFPIIVAALSAKIGELLVIENPEVHLHPAGQALMGQFLAEVSNAGIQVIVESHSDHVLNGIRRAVKSKKIKSTNVALHFFRPRNGDEAQVISPVVDSNGNIDCWPEGFFDQFDKDMNYFADWGA